MALRSEHLAADIDAIEKALTEKKARYVKVADAELLRLAHRANAVAEGIRFFQGLLGDRRARKVEVVRRNDGGPADP